MNVKFSCDKENINVALYERSDKSSLKFAYNNQNENY